MAGNKAIIKLRDFSFSYGGKNKILKNISLDIFPGERILILGPSGSGKSTLALCLNGIIPQLISGEIEGTVIMAGMDVLNTPVSILSRHAGIVFQDPESQFCMLKVADELAFGLENLMVDRKTIKEKTIEALEKVGLLPNKDQALMHLSGGMKQRVALASLLAIDQDIMIFDEPSSNLDPGGTREISGIIRRMPKKKTLIVIEHKLDEFIDIFDRILLLDRQGRDMIFGTPAKIFMDHSKDLIDLGVWIPQIPKYLSKLKKSGILLPGFPSNISNAKKAIKSLKHNRTRAYDILKKELNENVLAGSGTADSSGPTVIKVEKLDYRFKKGGDLVLDGIGFSVASGDFLGIIGPNGSGKTTLAKLIIDLYQAEPPSKIEIYRRKGKKLTLSSSSEIQEFTGFVFQNPEHQFIEDTVIDEITYGLRMRSHDSLYIKSRSEEMMNLLDLKGLEEANPFNLSQGQKRRLSVASILVMDHDILILDEPTFGMDHRTTSNLMKILSGLNRKGKTIIIITHDMNIIFKYTRRALVLKQGRLAYLGPTSKLLKEEKLIEDCSLSLPPLYKLYKEVGSLAVL